jgi:hypothetical protein
MTFQMKNLGEIYLLEIKEIGRTSYCSIIQFYCSESRNHKKKITFMHTALYNVQLGIHIGRP